MPTGTHRRYLIAVSTLVIVVALYSPASTQQTWEEYRESQKKAYQQYLSEQDAAFADFLEREWKAFQATKPLLRDSVPKPPAPPRTDPQPMPEPAPEDPGITPAPEFEPDIEVDASDIPKIDLPPPPKRQWSAEPPNQPGWHSAQARFYGHQLDFQYPTGFAAEQSSNDGFAEFWRSVADTEYPQVVKQISDARLEFNLNDWGTFLLIQELTAAIHPRDRRSATALAWFLNVQSGFDVRIGYSRDELYLLAALQQTAYGVSYLTLDGERYFFISHRDGDPPGSIRTYDDRPAMSLTSISLALNEPPHLGSTMRSRKWTGELLGGQRISVDAEYSPDLIAFLADYPQTGLDIRLSMAPDPRFELSLQRSLNDQLTSDHDIDNVYTLMALLHALAYQTDQEQFGYEKYMFPDEVLAYPYADCEDRSALFAYMVRRFLRLNVLVIVYPGHVSTAVELSGAPVGDVVEHGGHVYAICDPTYIGSTPGMNAPAFKTLQPLQYIALTSL